MRENERERERERGRGGGGEEGVWWWRRGKERGFRGVAGLEKVGWRCSINRRWGAGRVGGGGIGGNGGGGGAGGGGNGMGAERTPGCENASASAHVTPTGTTSAQRKAFSTKRLKELGV